MPILPAVLQELPYQVRQKDGLAQQLIPNTIQKRSSREERKDKTTV